MILISFIHITVTERNITHKIRERFYKKYRFHRCSGKNGITNCTTAKLITLVYDIFSLSKT